MYFNRATKLLLGMHVQWFVVRKIEWCVKCTIFLQCLVGQHSLNLSPSVIKIWLLKQPVSVYFPRERGRDDTYRGISSKFMNRNVYQNRLTSFSWFCVHISDFCTVSLRAFPMMVLHKMFMPSAATCVSSRMTVVRADVEAKNGVKM